MYCSYNHICYIPYCPNMMFAFYFLFLFLFIERKSRQDNSARMFCCRPLKKNKTKHKLKNTKKDQQLDDDKDDDDE